jgi:hypothetical protein
MKVVFLLVHHPRKPDELRNYNLLENPTEWMEQSCGSYALVQNTTFRIGIQKADDDSLILRCFVKTIGWGDPINLVRAKDPETNEPIGYRAKSPLDDLEEKEREGYEKLPRIFSTGQVKETFRLTSNPANKKIEKWEGLGLVKRLKRGEYRKLWGAPKGEQRELSS